MLGLLSELLSSRRSRIIFDTNQPRLISENEWYPRQDSNLCTRFRKPVLYPLSYGGYHRHGIASQHAAASASVDTGASGLPYWKEANPTEVTASHEAIRPPGCRSQVARALG